MTIALIDSVKNMTHYNDHTGARLAITMELKLDQLFEAYGRIQSDQNRLGHLSTPSYLDRGELDRKLKIALTKLHRLDLWAEL